MTTKRAEAAIQRALVAWLPEDMECVATLNENNRHCMDMGCEEGIADLLLFKVSREDDIKYIFYLELKTKTGKLLPSQKKWRAEKYRPARNTHYDVAYGFSDAKNKITLWVDSFK